MKNIDLKIEASRLRLNIERSSRLRMSVEVINYTNPNYLVILDDYFVEDFIIDYTG